MADIPAIKVANDAAVTNKSSVDSLSPADEGGRLNAITDELRPYKVYTALVTQTDTNPPVVTILENSIGNIVWTRSGPGEFIGTLAGAFPEGKVIVWLNEGYWVGLTQWEWVDINSIEIISGNYTGAPEDDSFVNGALEIRVYP